MELGIKEKWNKLKDKLSDKASEFGEKSESTALFKPLKRMPSSDVHYTQNV